MKPYFWIVPKYGYNHFEGSTELSGYMTTQNKTLVEFGKRLQELREKKGFSTREFAYEAEISHSSVGRLEAGLSNPTLTTLIKIAKALQVDLNTLLPSNQQLVFESR